MSEDILLSRFSFSDSRNSPLNVTSVISLRALLGLSVCISQYSPLPVWVFCVSFTLLFFSQHDLSSLVCLHLYCQARVDSMIDLKESHNSSLLFLFVRFITGSFSCFVFYVFNVGFVHSNKSIISLIHASHYFDAPLKGYGMVLNFTYLFLSVFILAIVYFFKWFGILTYSIILGGGVLVSLSILSLFSLVHARFYLVGEVEEIPYRVF